MLRAPEPDACPFEVVMDTVNGEEPSRLTISFDPETGNLDAFGEDGEKIEPKKDEKAKDADASLELLTYADMADRMELSWQGTEDPRVFTAEDLPKGSVDMAGTDISKNARARLELSAGTDPLFITRYASELTKPQRVKMVAKVQRFEQQTDFDMVQGWPRPVRQEMTGEFTALGRTQSFSMIAAYTYGSCKDAR
jgi:hypothetical protein